MRLLDYGEDGGYVPSHYYYAINQEHSLLLKFRNRHYRDTWIAQTGGETWKPLTPGEAMDCKLDPIPFYK